MSKKEVTNTEVVEETSVVPEKKETKYDKKVKARELKKKKKAREELCWKIAGYVILVAIVAGIASVPIRSYIGSHKEICTVAGESVNQVMFDYYYNTAKDNYLNTYSAYLSYMGLSADSDMSTVAYSDTMTFQDYFEEMAIDQIKETKAVVKEGKAQGYSYDASKDYDKQVDYIKKSASEAGMTTGKYVKTVYGKYATVSRLKDSICESLYANSYYQQLQRDNATSEEDALAYYEENKDSYDLVTYRQITVSATLPTEPSDGTVLEEGATYEPTDEEIEAAMAVAKAEAEEKLAVIEEEGDLREKESKSDANYNLTDFLFDESRVEGDTDIVENSSSHVYYVVQFVSRELDLSETVNLRIVVTEKGKGNDVLTEWNSGAATEERFIELVDKYSTSTSTNGGLYENQTKTGLADDISAWLSEDRQTGDVASFNVSDTSDFVIYYVSEGDPEYIASIKSTLTGEYMEDFVSSLKEAVEVLDPKDNLAFIKIREQEEADAAAEAEAEAAEEAATEEGTEVTTEATAE